MIPVAEFLTGDPIQKTFPVQGEPKSGKKKNSKPGMLHVTLHYPAGKKVEEKPAPAGANVPAPEKPKTVEETYTFGKVLGT